MRAFTIVTVSDLTVSLTRQAAERCLPGRHYIQETACVQPMLLLLMMMIMLMLTMAMRMTLTVITMVDIALCHDGMKK